MDRRKFLKFLAGAGLAATSLGLRPRLAKAFRINDETPRLVILYATCTVNKSFLSPYNPSVGYTPNLQKFASQAAVFDSCRSECGQSGIAYAAILSGCQADIHGIFSHPSKIDDSVYLITEAFSDAGYDVYFWGGHPMADYKLNYGQGTKKENAFPYPLLASDRRFGDILKRVSSDPNYRAFILTTFSVTHEPYFPVFPPYPSLPFYSHSKEEYRKFYETQIIEPEFEQVGINIKKFKHYYDIYLKNCLPLMLEFEKTTADLGLSQKETRELIKVIEYTYKVNIRRLDILWGDVITKIENYGLFGKSLIVFTADHGEVLFRRNALFRFTHGFQLAPEVLSAPLMISGPALGIKPRYYTQSVRSIDIAPTIAGLCKTQIPKQTEGIDLSDAICDSGYIPSLPAFSHTALPPYPDTIYEAIIDFFINHEKKKYKGTFERLFPDKKPESMWVAVKKGDIIYKIAKFDYKNTEFRPAVFDLKKDPEEKRNLFDPRNNEHIKAINELREYKKRLIKAYQRLKDRNSDSIDRQEKIRRLRSLGYI